MLPFYLNVGVFYRLWSLLDFRAAGSVLRVSQKDLPLFRRKQKFKFIIQAVGWNECGWNIDDCGILVYSCSWRSPTLLLVAFSGAAKCSEPRSGPVCPQTGGAGERVCHTIVSRWVCSRKQMTAWSLIRQNDLLYYLFLCYPLVALSYIKLLLVRFGFHVSSFSHLLFLL